jgi:two-component system response regulator HupR/HoxA
LIVDDEYNQRVTASALLEERFNVQSAGSGHEALHLLQRYPIDVICADFQMPGMDGLQLLLRAAAFQRDIGCILVTGHRDFLSREGGGDERLLYSVLLKPYDVGELMDRVARAAQLSGIRRRLVDSATGTTSERRQVR